MSDGGSTYESDDDFLTRMPQRLERLIPLLQKLALLQKRSDQPQDDAVEPHLAQRDARVRRETAREGLDIVKEAFGMSVKDWRRKRIIKQFCERFGLEDGDAK